MNGQRRATKSSTAIGFVLLTLTGCTAGPPAFSTQIPFPVQPPNQAQPGGEVAVLIPSFEDTPWASAAVHIEALDGTPVSRPATGDQVQESLLLPPGPHSILARFCHRDREGEFCSQDAVRFDFDASAGEAYVVTYWVRFSVVETPPGLFLSRHRAFHTWEGKTYPTTDRRYIWTPDLRNVTGQPEAWGFEASATEKIPAQLLRK